MSKNSSIEWTESTWNPITGCTKISLGCHNCYAERMAKRLKSMKQPNYKNGFNVTLHPNSLKIPTTIKSPQKIFVNSMSDLFHKSVPTRFILDIFEIMNKASWHQYQILTKRSARMCALDYKIPWSEHIWMGVTVEDSNYKFRIEDLRKTNARIKFISFEPLLGPIGKLNLNGIDWVIVGGESGPKARPISENWVLQIKNQCENLNIPFFFKQWGGTRKKKNGRLLLNKTWNDLPVKSIYR